MYICCDWCVPATRSAPEISSRMDHSGCLLVVTAWVQDGWDAGFRCLSPLQVGMVGGKQRPSNVVANMCWDASRRHTYYIIFIYIYILYKFQTSLLDTRGRADFVKTCLTYVILTCSFLSDHIASITALQTTIPSFHESSQTCWPKSKTTGRSSRAHSTKQHRVSDEAYVEFIEFAAAWRIFNDLGRNSVLISTWHALSGDWHDIRGLHYYAATDVSSLGSVK